MTGSMTWAEYESDDGTSYSISINKQNSRIILGGGATRLSSPRSANLPPVPRSLIVRQLFLIDYGNPKHHIVVTCCKRNFWRIYIEQTKNTTVDNYLLRYYQSSTPPRPPQTFLISGYKGEQWRDVAYLSDLPEINTNLVDR
jgi:hypothetical protein